MEKDSTVLIIDFGSQYTQLLARRVREAGVYSAILPCTASAEAIQKARPSAIILSGGPESVFDSGAQPLPAGIVELQVPILGICYGMQLLAHTFEGTVAEKNVSTDYHSLNIQTVNENASTSVLWNDVPHSFSAWTAWGNTVTTIPKGFVAIAQSASFPIAAIANEERKIYGLQFQPDVEKTATGMKIIQNFLYKIAKLERSWTIPAFIERCIRECREQVGDKKVVLGLSGGIDSTVVAALLHKAIGKQLHCIYVDQGLMRKNETAQVQEMLNKYLPGLNLHIIDASATFLGRLDGVCDPEEKRKIIGHTFIETFDTEAHKISNVHFLAQGTVYPDIIESYSPKGTVIKSHHNVGGLPDTMKLALVEPLRELFKDEVRAVGEELGLPEEVVWRHPFPGPGLAIRVLGAITPERIKLLQNADAIVLEELHNHGLYRKVWQGFAVLLPLRTVGGRADGTRTYDNVVALRIVDSIDAMTAHWSRVPYDVLEVISSRIIEEVAGINRVVFDISSKPPSTIEWE